MLHKEKTKIQPVFHHCFAFFQPVFQGKTDVFPPVFHDYHVNSGFFNFSFSGSRRERQALRHCGSRHNLRHPSTPSERTASFPSCMRRSMPSAIRFLYSFISWNSQSAVSAYSMLYLGVYHFFRHSADYFSAIWRSIVLFRTIFTESSFLKRGFITKSLFCLTNTVLSKTAHRRKHCPFPVPESGPVQ